MTTGNGDLSKWLRTGIPLLVYVGTLVWGAATVRSDLEYLSGDLTGLQTDMKEATSAIRGLTRSFDREGTERAQRIQSLEEAVGKLERRLESLEIAVRRFGGDP